MSIAWPEAVEIRNWDGSALSSVDPDTCCAVITRLVGHPSKFVAYGVNTISGEVPFLVWGSYSAGLAKLYEIMGERGIRVEQPVKESDFITDDLDTLGQIDSPPNTEPPSLMAIRIGMEGTSEEQLAA